MGSCASVNKGTPDSAMKLGLSVGSRKDKLVTPESPIKDKQVISNHTPIRNFDSYGSKEETFFDTEAWLDSDCEDDFFSVNGDFIPSCGNTPVHNLLAIGLLQPNKTFLEDGPPPSTVEPSPTGKRRLSELFKESIREDANDQNASGNQDIASGKMEAKPTILDVLPNSFNGTPCIAGANSFCSSERTPDGEALTEREKSIKSVHCCLPSLISCRSFNERKKKMTPAVAVNDKA